MSKIKPGTEVELEPGEIWRVLEPVDRYDFPSYRCEQITGDTSKYQTDRNEDGTIDMDAEAIEIALTAARDQARERRSA